MSSSLIGWFDGENATANRAILSMLCSNSVSATVVEANVEGRLLLIAVVVVVAAAAVGAGGPANPAGCCSPKMLS